MLSYAIPNGIQAQKLQEKIRHLEREKDRLVIDFIDRSIRAGKTELLKDTMWAYESKMTHKSISYLNDKIKIEKVNKNKQYIYCDIEFTPGGKTYCYRTDSQLLNVGDTVLVPVGQYSKKTMGVTRNIKCYEESTVPFPLTSTRVIIGKCDAKGNLV